ncbi:hypothetical protein RUND412_001698 [Rhizina undulata]
MAAVTSNVVIKFLAIIFAGLIAGAVVEVEPVGQGLYRRAAKAEAEPEAWHPRPGQPIYRLDTEPEPESWNYRVGQGLYRREANAEPEAPGQPIYRREAEPGRFKLIGAFRDAPAP